ncbi:MAG: dTDP-4-dehydrorhamnose reductase [Phycisphaerales bacterium]|nr:dTDP-4-dehydrorhamnose reductase [Phycisphaerales bacterium]
MPGQAVVLGARGMVGRSWCGLLTAHQIPFRALARPDFDLDQPATLVAAVEKGNRLVVNAAAWTDVDGAESDEPAATRANAEAAGVLAERCATVGATLIHYSTDYVFSGQARSPYPVDAPIEPMNAYGRSKAAGEAAVRGSGTEHLIIRTSWVYAPWGKNFVRTIAKLAAERDRLEVVNDQRGRPTSAEHLAASSLALYLAGANGTWHATDAGECTWFDFATAIAEQLGSSCSVEACTSEKFPRPARRPAYSTLDLEQTEGLIGPLADWRVALSKVLCRIDQTG